MTEAASPITKIFGFPGTVRSDSTMTLPDSSVSEPTHCPAGDATTPAAQITVAAKILSPPIVTPSLSHPVTGEPRRTVTPSFSSDWRAYSDSDASKAGRTRGPASTRITWALRGSMRRKSAARVKWASSAMVPASSTPVGPPPTMTNRMSRSSLVPSVVVSAFSKAIRIRRRTSVASSIVFRPDAAAAQSSWPK